MGVGSVRYEEVDIGRHGDGREKEKGMVKKR